MHFFPSPIPHQNQEFQEENPASQNYCPSDKEGIFLRDESTTTPTLLLGAQFLHVLTLSHVWPRQEMRPKPYEKVHTFTKNLKYFQKYYLLGATEP